MNTAALLPPLKEPHATYDSLSETMPRHWEAKLRTRAQPPQGHFFVGEAFVTAYAEHVDSTIEMIPEETMTALLRHPWPGSIRERRNLFRE